MPNRMTDRYNVTQKYLMTRGQAINFPAEYVATFSKLKKNDVFGVVIDIPMSTDILTTMVCFINGAANIYFNNGGEYTGASQKYRNLVQAAHTLVANAGQLLPKCTKTKSYDLPKGRTNNIFLLTKGGVYKTELKSGLIPETEPELRTFYVLYQRVLSEIRSCQLKDEADRRNASNK
jgi:ATP adenylyltransferase/5',5'''-P-1,P-4-tetraphosphate phosphorylase II